eukprot:21696-Eustigmatos_ZCMA.PRE.1
MRAVPVPGAAAGGCDSVERYGSKKLSMADLLAPAITMAEEGFPVRYVIVAAEIHRRVKTAAIVR